MTASVMTLATFETFIPPGESKLSSEFVQYSLSMQEVVQYIINDLQVVSLIVNRPHRDSKQNFRFGDPNILYPVIPPFSIF